MNFRKTLISAALISLSILAWPFAAGAAPHHVGKLVEKHHCDLNKDGREETICLKVVSIPNEEVSIMRLLVFSPEGKVIWRGPQTSEPSDPRVFGCWPWGQTSLDLVTDIDKDGKIELVGAMPQSDVRPTVFRIWRWNGAAFTLVGKKSLIEEPGHDQCFKWVKPVTDYHQTAWIGSLKKQKDAIIGTIINTHDMKKVKSGSAYLGCDADGFHIMNWFNPVK